MMAEKTVREEMADALEGYIKGVEVAEHLAGPANTYDWRGFTRNYRDQLQSILDRARAAQARPERESTCPDCGTDCPCYQEGANEGHSFGCNDDSCACWAAGHEAGCAEQREPAGGGTA